MKYSLRTKLSLSYVSVVLISVLLISVITNLLLDKHFKDYIIENQERKNKEIASQLNQQYKTGGEWDKETIGDICINALEQGMIIADKDKIS